ncbi:MAG TPA: molybdenum ABC transporter ATP-binding protein [Polyangiaceae bacterium]
MSGELDVQLAGRRGDFVLDARFRIPACGVSALFGRSGSGKTTLLRAVAGLERLNGVLRFRGHCWQDETSFVPAERRRIGYVFQEPALFPHLSVLENLRYAAKRARAGSAVPQQSAIEWAGIGALLTRRPDTLSGGERQRVAIARALVSDAVLLLMDEPLAALDSAARGAILNRLEQVRRNLQIPTLYVTHAVDEVARLADRVIWIDEGRVRAVGTPGELLSRLELGLNLGDEAGGLVPAVTKAHDDVYHLTELDSVWGTFRVPRLESEPGAPVMLRIRANDVSVGLAPDSASSILNVLPGEVEALEEAAPGQILLRLTCPADRTQALLARVTRRSVQELKLIPGTRVFLRVKSVNVR